ncbi:MAG: hypothetical protein ACN4G0_01705 [Polyangiales bacterium]
MGVPMVAPSDDKHVARKIQSLLADADCSAIDEGSHAVAANRELNRFTGPQAKTPNT